jgi:hypothetical protein
MQEGMLFHSMGDESRSDAYQMQFVVHLSAMSIQSGCGRPGSSCSTASHVARCLPAGGGGGSGPGRPGRVELPWRQVNLDEDQQEAYDELLAHDRRTGSIRPLRRC